MEKLNQSLNMKIAMTGVFGALSVVLAITPFGYIVIPGTPLSITIMHIPVIIVTLFSGFIPGVAVGLIFGITSMVRSMVLGTLFMYNPLVSVLPRFLFPMAVYLVARLISKIPHIHRGTVNCIAAAVGTFMHTLLVMGALYLIYFKDYIKDEDLKKAGRTFFGFVDVIAGIMLTNGIFEIIFAVVITAVFFSSLYLSSKNGSKLSRLKADIDDSKIDLIESKTDLIESKTDGDNSN